MDVYLPATAGAAWPDPFRLVNRMDFDYAPALAIAGGLVCFGSSADDTVRALDAKTGEEKWHFITGGPVRFAPQIGKGRVYFASDDGFVYCLEAATGKLVWKFIAAPYDERIVGNHRMISRWPIRAGVLVADGVVYAVAGMWPGEGVFVHALEAETGTPLWCNDTVGGTPQGALLLGGDVLLVPNGNAKTTPLDRRTGAEAMAHVEAHPAGWRTTWAIHGRSSGRGGLGRRWTGISTALPCTGTGCFASSLFLTNGLAGRAWTPATFHRVTVGA